MRIVIQRVSQAQVTVDSAVVGQIGAGLCVLLGISQIDDENQANFLADKTRNLRIFADAQGKMNRSVADVGGALLVVSQFTLYGDARKGNRPSFTEAAAPDRANDLYRHFVNRLRASGLTVATGQFGAHMKVDLSNDGPVTLILEA